MEPDPEKPSLFLTILKIFLNLVQGWFKGQDPAVLDQQIQDAAAARNKQLAADQEKMNEEYLAKISAAGPSWTDDLDAERLRKDNSGSGGSSAP